MQTYKQEFIRFLVEQGSLRFGEFTLKSGRISPYFVNIGNVSDGIALRRLGTYYAHRIREVFGTEFDLLFGPPYKGIGLAIASAMALGEEFEMTVPFSFSRKEEKAHGDTGIFVGTAPKAGDRVILLDDVFTTGKTKEDAVELLKGFGAEVIGVVIAVDRLEVGPEGKSAILEFEAAYGIPVHAVVTIREIIDALHGKAWNGKTLVNDRIRAEVEAYLEKWGAPDRGTDA
ncbi:MAG: orotate phosphoribosyltransferase [Planctomycetota bacterium]|jgi:orotate phosphoribosyltransferase